MLAEYSQLFKVLKKVKEYEVVLAVFLAAIILLGFLLCGRVSRLKNETRQLSGELGDLKSSLATSLEEKNRMAELVLENTNLQTEVKELRAQNLARLNYGVQSPQMEILKREIDQLKIQNAAFKDLQTKYASLEKERDALKKENSGLKSHKADSEDLLSENDILVSENRRLKAENEYLKTQLGSLEVTLLRIYEDSQASQTKTAPKP